MKIGILCISTRKYHIFVQQLVDGIKQYFLLNHQIEVHLFTDVLEREFIGDDRVKVIKELIPAYTFPTVTLYRYKIFTQKTYDCDYLYYLDIDMAIREIVGEEIFGDIVATKHPGYSVVGGGSWETNKLSTAYTFPEDRVMYFAGGFQGGETEHYYRAMQLMKRNIDEDERNGVMPVWQDESIWNQYLSQLKTFKQLDSSYCMVEQEHLQKLWEIDGLPKRIIALEKNHSEIRS